MMQNNSAAAASAIGPIGDAYVTNGVGGMSDHMSAIMSRQNTYGRLENFEIEKQIGQGQFSQVFKARCLVDGRVVALKKMKVYII